MPGRNDPCPCGSGRKFKHCCLKLQDQADFLWRQVRSAEGRLVPALLDLSLSECGPGLIEAALDEFFVWDGVPEDFEESDEFASFFVPWFVYEFVADPHDDDPVPAAPEEPLAALYLRRHRERLSETERAFLEDASGRPMSFHAVTRTEAGREIALRDVLTGVDVVVRERTGSTTLRPGDLIFARVVTVGATSILTGCAPLVIPPEWHLPLIDFRERFAHGAGLMLTLDALRETDIELREMYFHIEDGILNPRMPELRNTDGDRLVWTTLTYRLQCGPSAAFDRLLPLARASKRDAAALRSEAELDEAGEIRAVTIPWSKRGNRMHQGWDNTTLGTLEIDADRLHVQVNSKCRARRIEREIAKRLGDDAVLESTTADPIEKLLAERKDAPGDPAADLEQELLQQQPEVQAYLKEQAERHWESWIDTPLPALRGRTPRQAAETPDGRERLEALFAEFRWRGEREGSMAPDVGALRSKLGLPHPA